MSSLPPGYTPPTYTPPPTYYQPPQEDKNGLAIAALVLGSVALVLGLIPGVGLVFGWLPGLLAIIFGLISGIPDRPRRKLGLTGVLLTVLGGIIAIVWIVVLSAIGAADSSDGDTSTQDTYSAPVASEPAAEPSAPAASDDAGDTASDDASSGDDSTSTDDGAADSFTPPSGYKQIADNVYFKWGKQDYSNDFVGKINGTVIAPEGCTSLIIQANLLDKNDTIVGNTSDIVSNIPAGGKAQVDFSIFNTDFDSIQLSKVNCYNF